MVHRLLVACLLLLAACAPSSTTAATTATTTRPTTTPTTTTTTTTTSTTRAPQPDHLVATEEYQPGFALDIFAPAEPGPYPVVVSVHGGAWFAGDRSSLGDLADWLAGRGVVVYNIDYPTLLDGGGGFPQTVDAVACAVRFASADAPHRTTTPGDIVVLGHSAGAHLAALVALAADRFGAGCPVVASVKPTGLIGLAGAYDTDRLSLLLIPFFGTRREQDPTPWEQGNPLTYATDRPDLPVLLVHGEDDPVLPPDFSEEFARALEAGGHRVDLEILPGVTHETVKQPLVVGQTIVAWLDRNR